MEDIREHHQLMQYGHALFNKEYSLTHSFRSPDCDLVTEPRATIMYTSLQTSHLNQVHDLLNRFFWQGIDGESNQNLTSIPRLPPCSI